MIYTKIVNFFAAIGLVIGVITIVLGIAFAVKFGNVTGAMADRQEAYSSMLAAFIVAAGVILPSALMGVLVDISHSITRLTHSPSPAPSVPRAPSTEDGSDLIKTYRGIPIRKSSASNAGVVALEKYHANVIEAERAIDRALSAAASQ